MDRSHSLSPSPVTYPAPGRARVPNRRRYVLTMLALAALALLLAAAPSAAFTHRADHQASAPSFAAGHVGQDTAHLREQVASQLQSAPLTFIKNQGQTDGRVAYYVPGSQTSLYFTREGVTIAQTAPAQATGTGRSDEKQRWAIKLDFVGANASVQPEGEAPLTTTVSYFHGAQPDWKTGLPTYGRIVYANLWPGIDAVFSGNGGQLKYAFLVKPGADPRQIRLAYRGATSVRLAPTGQLAVTTPVGGFTDDKPSVYQEAEGGANGRMLVQASYALEHMTDMTGTADGTADGTAVYGFHLGSYDASRLLVVDPAIIAYAGYIGGVGDGDWAHAVAVDASGSAYIAGETDSSQLSFPVQVGPDLTYNGGGADAFVAKVISSGSGTYFRYVSYIGGAQYDHADGIAVDASGDAYVVGGTSSNQLTFPVKLGPDLTLNGGQDAFIAEVNPTGTALFYCGYIGGEGNDTAHGVALDSVNSAYVTGETTSAGISFPLSVGPDLTFNGGSYDAFVTKVRPTSATIAYSGFIGGAGDDFGYGIAVDGSGQAYVTGYTSSPQPTFPVKLGPDLTYNGSGDAFITAVTTSGAGLVYSGYIGGSDWDAGFGVAVDTAGNAYVAGQAESDQATFPVKVGPGLTFNGTVDGFVAKVNPFGNGLAYAGYIGGGGIDGALGIAVDASGSAYITGNTNGLNVVVNGPDSSFNGGQIDAYVAKLTPNGSSYVYCGYIGGNGDDVSYAIAVDSTGAAYVAGRTGSTQATFPVLSGPDLTYNGGVQDAFVAKIKLQ